jgi:hypothetical protein
MKATCTALDAIERIDLSRKVAVITGAPPNRHLADDGKAMAHRRTATAGIVMKSPAQGPPMRPHGSGPSASNWSAGASRRDEGA